MFKLTNKKLKQVFCYLSEDAQCITWDSRKGGRVVVDQIREVRYGAEARPSLSGLPPNIAKLDWWISIIYIRWPSSWKTLNVLALSEDSFKLWVGTIVSLLSSIKTISHENGSIGILGSLEAIPVTQPASWSLESALDEDSKVSLGEVAKMCEKIGLTGGLVAENFRELDTDKKGYLSCSEFRLFVKQLRHRREIQELFCSLTIDGALDEKKFTRFLKDQQLSDLDEDACHQLFELLSSKSANDSGLDTNVSHETSLSYDSFAVFLSSPENAILSIKKRRVYQEMTRPLPEYYISSSHNTYLLGHQWKGDSTVEGYIRALLAGCRSVELDCWDGDDGLPVIYHGKTLTSSVPVREVCAVIKRYAFMASPYPIILSAEVHCSLEQQVQLVTILKEVFGDALITKSSPVIKNDGNLPSPEQLRNRVLFKSKRPIEETVGGITDNLSDLHPWTISSSTESTTESDLDREIHASLPAHAFFKRVSNKVSYIVNESSNPSSLSDRLSSGRAPSRRAVSVDSISATGISRRTRPRVAPEITDLLIYTAGVKYQGFSKLITYEVSDMFSISEKTANKIYRSTPADLIKHNRTHVSRVYPQGTRLTSTNYEPQRYWAMGCQLVALNWQTSDIGFMINSAMFARNGRCGYVLKPTILTTKSKDVDWIARPFKLDMKILSGQFLPKLPDVNLHDMRLFVQVILHMPTPTAFMQDQTKSPGLKSDPSSSTVTKRFRTEHIKGNTYNPLWNEDHSLTFSCTPELLDLAFLEMELRHEPALGDDICIAQWCGALGTIEQGYRYIPLSDAQMSEYLFSTLFVSIAMT